MMTPKLEKEFLEQLDSLIQEWSPHQVCQSGYDVKYIYGGFFKSGTRIPLDLGAISKMVTQAMTALERIGGIRSFYYLRGKEALQRDTNKQPQLLLGILKALRDDVAAGYLQTFEERIHSEVFENFLEQAELLFGESKKIPAAAIAATVIAGVSLETHLRKLCEKHSIPTEKTNPDGKSIPLKASEMNDALAKKEVYSKGDQKQVTAWLDHRNTAAHGKDAQPSKDQVKLMIEGIRNFIVRNPA